MQSKSLQRTVTLLLLAGMLLTPVLSSCAEKTDDASGGAATTTSSDESLPEETDRTHYRDNLPNDLNFDGAKFSILARGDQQFLIEFYVEEEKAETVEDAIFKRNSKVSERLNISYDVVKGYPSNEYGEELKRISSNVIAGDESYNAIAGYSVQIVKLMVDNIFVDLNTVNYLDFEMPWWPESVVKEMNFNDKLYFCPGDICYSTTSKAVCMYFNKKLQQDNNVEDIYDVVNSGAWTLEKLNEVCRGMYSDLDGNGKRGKEDQYGLTMTSYNSVDAFIPAFHQNVTQLDEDGYPELCMNNERMVTIMEGIYDLMNDNDGVYVPKFRTDDAQTMFEMFKADQSLFMMWEFTGCDNLRDMESDFGVIPYPKLNDAQDGYGTYMQDGHSLVCIPITTRDLDLTGAVLEALAAESYRSVTPAYFEIALQSKYSRDNESMQMMEVIRDSIKYNFGYVYLVDALYTGRDMMNTGSKGSRDFASYWAKHERPLQKTLQKMIDKYQSNQ